MPSLDHAYLKLDRAREHLTSLKALNDEVCAAHSKAVVITRYVGTIEPGKAGEVLHVDNAALQPVPDKCGVLVGDVVQSLRAPLDYLIAELAILDSGHQGRTQFPIESTQDGFNNRKKSFLAGLNPAHVAAIESLQPYSGCGWTKLLAALSNEDKHNRLVFVTHDQLVTISTNPELSPEGATGRIRVDCHIQPVLRIDLNGIVPLVEALEDIYAQVIVTLDRFRDEF